MDNLVGITERTYRQLIARINKLEAENNSTRGESRAKLNRRMPTAKVAFVEITAVTDFDDYTGKVLVSPFDNTVIETGVPIKAINTTVGELDVGDQFYAYIADNGGTPTYIITPPVLS